MPVPGVERAVIEPRKLRDYLLSPAHPVGRFKAAFFASLGYTQDTWGVLSADLQAHAASGDVQAEEASTFGKKYEVTGILKGPAGKQATVVSVGLSFRERISRGSSRHTREQGHEIPAS